jgi:hypothetical protein
VAARAKGARERTAAMMVYVERVRDDGGRWDMGFSSP